VASQVTLSLVPIVPVVCEKQIEMIKFTDDDGHKVMTNPHMRNEIMNPFQLLFHRAVRNIKKTNISPKQNLFSTNYI
jgi:hypothetical protein